MLQAEILLLQQMKSPVKNTKPVSHENMSKRESSRKESELKIRQSAQEIIETIRSLNSKFEEEPNLDEHESQKECKKQQEKEASVISVGT